MNRTVPIPTGDDPERREDLDGRVRIAELEARYRKVARDLRIAMLVLGVGVVLALLGFKAVLSRVQDSRERAALSACHTRNTQNRGIAKFVAGVAPGLSAKVVEDFPIEPNCAAYARRVVSTGTE